jgi:hypothetical protein
LATLQHFCHVYLAVMWPRIAAGKSATAYGPLVAVLRTYAAFLAGLSRMRWSRFLQANAAGGVLWTGLYAFGAYALGSAASSVGSTITIVGWAVADVLTAATIVIGRRSLQRLEQRAEDAFPDHPSLSPSRRAGRHDQPGSAAALASAPTGDISGGP